jgi:hypothetical protein
MLVLGLLVALGAAACSDSEPTSSGSASSAPTSSTTATSGVRREADDVAVSGTFAGMVEGSDTYAAVVVGPDGDALAYVCDGASSVDFLDGRLEGDAATLGNDGGARVEATFAEGGVSGTFARPGYEPVPFTAPPVDAPAGLYRAEASFTDRRLRGWLGPALRRHATRRGQGIRDAPPARCRDRGPRPEQSECRRPRRFSHSPHHRLGRHLGRTRVW